MSQQEVTVPDIGEFKDVEVIDVLVSAGDAVHEEDSLITLESDKASMDVPSPFSGKITNISIHVGDKVSEGSKILTMDVEASGTEEKRNSRTQAVRTHQYATFQKPQAGFQQEPKPPQQAEALKEKSRQSDHKTVQAAAERNYSAPRLEPVDEQAFAKAYASPSVRRFARELGVDLGQIQGSGRNARIVKEDVQEFVKRKISAPLAEGFQFPSTAEVDFSRFGETEIRPLSRIQKISADHLHRNWVAIPHVTQFDEADITDLEAYRGSLKSKLNKQSDGQQPGTKLTLLPFIMKACAAALKAFPDVNASLHADKQQLVLKKYFHIAFAVDTDEGLLVPVVRDVDKKGVLTLNMELTELSQKARRQKLSPVEMQGACITISNLGGIGGTAFTPIINAPEVAILGISRSVMKPVFKEGEFKPRLMLPLSFSYDHRVIDGAKAARFCSYLCELISDIRGVLL